MITADALARELGCTLTDLADTANLDTTPEPDQSINGFTAEVIRLSWAMDETQRAKAAR